MGILLFIPIYPLWQYLTDKQSQEQTATREKCEAGDSAALTAAEHTAAEAARRAGAVPGLGPRVTWWAGLSGERWVVRMLPRGTAIVVFPIGMVRLST